MKMRHRLLTVALAGGMLVLLGACASTNGPELTNTTWVLNTGEEPTENISLAGFSNATITFGPAAGEVTGNYGINKYVGGYEVDGDSIRFSDLRWTTMACMAAGGTMNTEQAYMFALEKAHTYGVDKNTLTIECGDETLEFTRQ